MQELLLRKMQDSQEANQGDISATEGRQDRLPQRCWQGRYELEDAGSHEHTERLDQIPWSTRCRLRKASSQPTLYESVRG
jgi:hypothetical protein